MTGPRFAKRPVTGESPQEPQLMAVFRRPAARRDLVERYVYLAEYAGEQVADRFLMNAEASFISLTEHPEISAPLSLRPGARWSAQMACERLREISNLLRPAARRRIDRARSPCGAGLVGFAGNRVTVREISGTRLRIGTDRGNQWHAGRRHQAGSRRPPWSRVMTNC